MRANGVASRRVGGQDPIDVAGRIESIRRRVSAVEEDLDDLALSLTGPRPTSPDPHDPHTPSHDGAAGPIADGAPSGGDDPNSFHTRGASEACIVGKTERDAMVFRIDGAEITLKPALAALLIALAADDGRADGPYVPWKTYDEIAAHLTRITSRAYKRKGTITEYISRLRKSFEKAGLPRSLIRTRRGVGARFLLRRGGAANLGEMIAADDGR